MVGRIWCPIRGVDCKNIGDNHFLFNFHLVAGKRKALEEGPWMLLNEMLLIADFNGSKTLEEINFSYILIWIHISNLPLGMLSKAMREVIEDEIVEFVEANVGDDDMVAGSFLRVKIKLDIHKPLMLGDTVQTKERWSREVVSHGI
jgi:hypothetical protein